MRLRSDVELELSENEGKLYDPLFDRRITLGGTSAHVVRWLDGERGPDQLAAEESGRSREADRRRAAHALAPEPDRRQRRRGAGAHSQARRAVTPSWAASCSPSRALAARARATAARAITLGHSPTRTSRASTGSPSRARFPSWRRRTGTEREMPNSDQHRALSAQRGKSLPVPARRLQVRAARQVRLRVLKPGLCRYYPFRAVRHARRRAALRQGRLLALRHHRALGPAADRAAARDSARSCRRRRACITRSSSSTRPRRSTAGYLQPLLRVAVDELEKPPATAPEMLRAYARRTEAITQALKSCRLSPEAPEQAVSELVARGPAPYLAPASPEAVRAGAAALGQVVRAYAQRGHGHHLVRPSAVDGAVLGPPVEGADSDLAPGGRGGDAPGRARVRALRLRARGGRRSPSTIPTSTTCCGCRCATNSLAMMRCSTIACVRRSFAWRWCRSSPPGARG